MIPPPCESAASPYRVGLLRFESGCVLVFHGGVFECSSRMNGKPSSPVLRGLGASNGARLLDHVEFSMQSTGNSRFPHARSVGSLSGIASEHPESRCLNWTSPNCVRAENSAIPCRDSCPVQAILYPRAPKISPEGTRAVYVFNRMEEYGRFRDPVVRHNSARA